MASLESSADREAIGLATLKSTYVGEELRSPASTVVRLSEPTAEWAMTFDRERERLEETLGPILIDVHHIGSTAIPIIRAKPTVDIMPVISNLALLDGVRPRLEALGFDWWGEYGIEGRRFCTLSDAAVHAHFFQQNAPEVERHLAFRDYLRARSDIAKEYEAVKVAAANANPHNSNDYSEAKSQWISSTQRAAIKWHRSLRSQR